MKLLCLFVLVALCAALCAAQPVDNLVTDYIEASHIRARRQAVIQNGPCPCPLNYVLLLKQCVECKKYLEDTGEEECPVCTK